MSFGTIKGTVLALGLCAGIAALPNRAEASFGVGVGFVAPAPGPVYYGGGHYESRVQRVLVVPETHERRWVEPAYQTTYVHGYAETVAVGGGHYHDICIPARYEDRYIQVWVPDSAVVVERPYYPAPVFGFGFGYGRRHW